MASVAAHTLNFSFILTNAAAYLLVGVDADYYPYCSCCCHCSCPNFFVYTVVCVVNSFMAVLALEECVGIDYRRCICSWLALALLLPVLVPLRILLVFMMHIIPVFFQSAHQMHWCTCRCVDARR